MVTKILHFADVHLGMTNFGHLDPQTGLHSRILEYLSALDCVVDAVEVYQPDVVLFAGDAFKTRTPSPTLVGHLSERFQAMADVAPVICVVGNHDRQKGGSGKRHAIDILSELHASYEIFVLDTVECLCTDTMCVITLPWFYEDEVSLPQVCQMIDAALEKAPPDLPKVLLGHAEVEGAVYNDAYVASFSLGGKGIVYPLSLLTEDFDYVALGHVHRYQALSQNPPVVYCGAIERVTWADRDEPKGFVTAEVSLGRAGWKFHDSHAREMVQIDLPYDRGFSRRLSEYGVDGKIVRVHISTKKPLGRSALISEIGSALRGNYLLDGVSITDLSKADRQPFDGQRFESKSAFELLELYLRGQYPNDDNRVSTLLDTAHKMIEEHDADLQAC